MAITLADAIAITGATSGAVLATQSVTIQILTAPQKTALVAFITSLGLPISSANITQVQVGRQVGAPGNIWTYIQGLVQPASAAAAITNRSQYDDIIGVVP